MLELYQKKSSSLPQKFVLLAFEAIFLLISYFILFKSLGHWFFHGLFIYHIPKRFIILFIFSLVLLIRMSITMFVFLQRSISWSEALSIPFAFILYFLGFPLFIYTNTHPLGWSDGVALFLFFLGSFLNTFSEFQRFLWKKKEENKGKLYTKGLFSLSMHINYFGDLLWVLGYVILTQNLYSSSILLLLFLFFVFYNIPLLDNYLKEKYPEFEEYEKSTKKLIPFIF